MRVGNGEAKGEGRVRVRGPKGVEFPKNGCALANEAATLLRLPPWWVGAPVSTVRATSSNPSHTGIPAKSFALIFF